MAKRRSVESDGQSSRKTDSAVLVAIIGGTVTIVATLITVVLPILLKPKEATLASSPTAGNSQAALAAPVSTSSAPAGISTAPAAANDLVSVAMANLKGVRVASTDTFDSLSAANWDNWSNSPSAGLDNGALKVTGASNEDVGFRRNNRPFGPGQGVVLHFKYTGDPAERVSFYFYFNELNAQWPQMQRFVLYDNEPPYTAQVNLHYAENKDTYQDLESAPLKLDTWYGLLMVVGPKADLLAIIWDPNDPLHQIRYEEAAGNPDWLNLYWLFGLGLLKGRSGSLYVDDFTEISFSSIK